MIGITNSRNWQAGARWLYNTSVGTAVIQLTNRADISPSHFSPVLKSTIKVTIETKTRLISKILKDILDPFIF